MPLEIARQLQARDIDAITVRELGALGNTMGRVLCTYDTDYIALATKGIEHAGLVIGQPESHCIGEWVNWLELMNAVYTPEEMQNHVEYM